MEIRREGLQLMHQWKDKEGDGEEEPEERRQMEIVD